MKVLIFIAAALAGFFISGAIASCTTDANAATYPPKLNAVASWLAMRPVRVQCDTRDEALVDITLFSAYAYVTFPDSIHPDNHMVVHPDICAPLIRWLKDGVRNVSEKRLALSVLVITHESSHLRGVSDEAEAECWAVRHVRYVARRLGFSAEEARTIRDLALKWDAEHNRKYPEYNLPGCKRPQAGSP